MDAVRSWLYIGKYAETIDLNLLRSYGIQAMLQLANPAPQPNISSLFLPVEDGVALPTNYLRTGLDYVLSQYKQGHTVLVACGAGISRSATFTIAALKEAEGLRLTEALRQVRASHEVAAPHPALWQSICEYYGEDSERYAIYA